MRYERKEATMSHFKRRRRKNARAGCRLCKPWKANHAKEKRPAKERALREASGAQARERG